MFLRTIWLASGKTFFYIGKKKCISAQMFLSGYKPAGYKRAVPPASDSTLCLQHPKTLRGGAASTEPSEDLCKFTRSLGRERGLGLWLAILDHIDKIANRGRRIREGKGRQAMETSREVYKECCNLVGAHAKTISTRICFSKKWKLPGKDEPQEQNLRGSQRLSPNSTPSVCLSISHLVLPLC